MRIIDYTTLGGKNLIEEYIVGLTPQEQFEIRKARISIEEEGARALASLKTRQLRSKLWEIKLSANRIMYAMQDAETIYFLHICKKQKNKAEKFEVEKAIKRAKEFGIDIKRR